MSKNDFLNQLRNALIGLPQNEIEERISFYNEMIDDRMEEDLSEEDAVAEIGSVNEIAAQIMAEVPFAKQTTQQVKSKHQWKTWEIVLIIVGSPIWFPLLLAAVIVVFSLYGSAWAIIGSLWAVMVSLVLCALQGLVTGFFLLLFGGMWQSIAMLRIALVSAGLSVLFFFGCKAISKGLVHLTNMAVTGMKSSVLTRRN